MTDDIEQRPWWMSDPDEPIDDRGSAEGSPQQAPWSGLPGDMWSLLGTVGAVAGEWWAASGASEHTEHGDPADHPECAICKVLISVRTVAAAPQAPTALPPVRWLPLRRA